MDKKRLLLPSWMIRNSFELTFTQNLFVELKVLARVVNQSQNTKQNSFVRFFFDLASISDVIFILCKYLSKFLHFQKFPMANTLIITFLISINFAYFVDNIDFHQVLHIYFNNHKY